MISRVTPRGTFGLLASFSAVQQLESLQTTQAAQIDLLGKPSVVLPDGSRHMLTGKTAALIALTVIEGFPSCRRVAGMLWPESSESLARNNLRTLRHRLTRRLGVDLLDNGEQLGISPRTAVVKSWNAEELAEALVSSGTARCTLLADIDLIQLEDFQAWLGSARQRFSQQQLSTLDTALAAAVSNGQGTFALNFARACVALEPLSERWHRQLMQTHMIYGDRAAALATYCACKKITFDNFGVAPDDCTVKLLKSITEDDTSEHPVVLPQPTATKLAPLNGHDQQLKRLESALARGASMALHGNAGVGKTRLLNYFSHGKTVMTVGVNAGIGKSPYAALAQVLLAAQQEHMLRLDQIHRRELVRVAPKAFPQDKPSVDSGCSSSASLHAALRHWTKMLRAKGVTLLAIDNLQYADVSSQCAFAALIQPMPDEAQTLPVIFSYRSGDIVNDLAAVISVERHHNRLEEVPLEPVVTRWY